MIVDSPRRHNAPTLSSPLAGSSDTIKNSNNKNWAENGEIFYGDLGDFLSAFGADAGDIVGEVVAAFQAKSFLAATMASRYYLKSTLWKDPQ